MLLLFLLLPALVSGFWFMDRETIEKYTKVAYATDGSPCLGGCSSHTNQCIVDWSWRKKPCKQRNEPAPIYYTSLMFGSNPICLSNCAKFNRHYEWCITSYDNHWDFCSSHERGNNPATAQGYVSAYSKTKRRCRSECNRGEENGAYMCTSGIFIVNFCAKPAIPRVPVLPPDYQIGSHNKHYCNDFFKSLVTKSFESEATEYFGENLPNNFLQEMADTLESAAKMTDMSLFPQDGHLGSGIKSYMVTDMILGNGTNVRMPAVIRASVSKNTVRNVEAVLDMRIGGTERKKRDLESYERVISYELGGSDGAYNFVKQQPQMYKSWSQLQKAISEWSVDYGGSAEILVIVFYPNTQTNYPAGIGAAITLRDHNGELMGNCQDTIFLNI